jgi:transposase-like protein
MQIQPGNNGGQVCPRCQRLCSLFVQQCQCGYIFHNINQYSTPPPAVQIAQPSFVPGPVCPRCNSPYINQIADSNSGSGEVIALIICGFCIWALWALIPLSISRNSSTPFSCHNCGFQFLLHNIGKGLSQQTKTACYIGAGVLLVIQLSIGIFGQRN